MTGRKRSAKGEPEGLKIPSVPEAPELPEVPDIHVSLPPKPGRAELPSELHRAGVAYSIPAALIAPIVVLTLLGAWLDSRFGTGSKWTVGGAILGTVSGFINMIRLANKLNR